MGNPSNVFCKRLWKWIDDSHPQKIRVYIIITIIVIVMDSPYVHPLITIEWPFLHQ